MKGKPLQTAVLQTPGFRASCFSDSEVLNSSYVHLMKLSAGKPRFRKAANRCGSFNEKIQFKKMQN
jgi:hypothetical protein